MKKIVSSLSLMKKYFKKRPLKVLVVINHYYGKNKSFAGKSTNQDSEVRKKIIDKVINELQFIPGADVMAVSS